MRARCAWLLEQVQGGRSAFFRVRMDRLDPSARIVAEETRANYPSLDVPLHSRWRHFELDGENLWADYRASAFEASSPEAARAAIDLAVVSVLLDAGAGDAWRYRAQSGARFARSEGLAIASFELLRSGLLSSAPDEPLRADASRLAALDATALGSALQVTASNPLTGLGGRASLLRSLGAALLARTDVFGAETPRPGGLYDVFAAYAAAHEGALPAPVILATVLDALGGIWPNGASLGDTPLGDVWPHAGVDSPRFADATRGLLPLHKLSQWLSYSLVEPLQAAGLSVTHLDGLTGLAEYRNGGLLIDAGLLELRRPELAEEPLAVGEPLVVEWRALTVALLDRLLPLVRAHLRKPRLTLGAMLQGGSWSAGRRLAAERREGGAPPIRVASDGTVF